MNKKSMIDAFVLGSQWSRQTKGVKVSTTRQDIIAAQRAAQCCIECGVLPSDSRIRAPKRYRVHTRWFTGRLGVDRPTRVACKTCKSKFLLADVESLHKCPKCRRNNYGLFKV